MFAEGALRHAERVPNLTNLRWQEPAQMIADRVVHHLFRAFAGIAAAARVAFPHRSIDCQLDSLAARPIRKGNFTIWLQMSHALSTQLARLLSIGKVGDFAHGRLPFFFGVSLTWKLRPTTFPPRPKWIFM